MLPDTVHHAKCIQNSDIGRFVHNRTLSRWSATSRDIVSAETKINAMKSFEKSGREHAKEKEKEREREREREREMQQQFINRLMCFLFVTYRSH